MPIGLKAAIGPACLVGRVTQSFLLFKERLANSVSGLVKRFANIGFKTIFLKVNLTPMSFGG
jgi:hypothetical protein